LIAIGVSSSVSELLKLGLGCGNGADPATGPVVGVEIGAADRDESEVFRPVAPAAREAWACRGAGNFQGAQAGFGERRERSFSKIIARVGEGGNPACASDQADRLFPGESGLRHVCGAVVAEDAAENFAVARKLSGSDQPFGHMSPAQSRPWERAREGFEINRESEETESLGHGPDPSRPPSAQRRGRVHERRVIVAEEMAENVHFASLVLGRKLNAGDQLDAKAGCLGTCDGNCA
jgi:hypothetical protein